MISSRTMELDDGAKRDDGMSQVRITAADLTKEIAKRKLEGLRVQAPDAASLLGERSDKIGALKASGDTRHKEV